MLRSLAAVLVSTSLFASDDFRLDRVQVSLTATHLHYQQYIDGVPVIGGERIERTTRPDQIEVLYENRVERPPTRRATPGEVAGRSTVYVINNGLTRLAFRSIATEIP